MVHDICTVAEATTIEIDLRSVEAQMGIFYRYVKTNTGGDESSNHKY